MARSATLAPPSVEAPFSIRRIVAPLAAIIIGIFMVVLDGTAVNVALPRLVAQFHSTITTLQWTITGYTLAQAAVIPLAGWLSDRFGAKRIFLASITLFTLGSALCATAQSDGMLIAFRVVQGLGGGCVLPIAMAYIYRLSPPEKVGAVMGMLGIPILVAPAIGPVLAGWLVQYATWRWIFLLNLPVGVIGVLIGLRSLPSVSRQGGAALDRAGAVLGPLAFAALSYGLSQGATSWTSAQTLGGLGVGVVALLIFITVELRAIQPLLELRVFRSPDFSVGMVVQWVGQMALFGSFFLVPLYLQQARGYGAFDTGLILLPQAIAAAIFMPLSGVLFDRIGARPLAVAGLGIIAGAIYLLSHVTVSTQGRDLILPLAMNGAGMGLMLMAINTQLLNAAPRRLVSRVTSLTNALQQVVNSLAIAGLATILTSRITFHVNAVKATLAAHAPHLPSGAVPPPGPVHLPPSALAALAKATVTGFDDTFRYMVIAAVIAALMGLLLRRHPQASRDLESAEDNAGAKSEAAVAPGLLAG